MLASQTGTMAGQIRRRIGAVPGSPGQVGQLWQLWPFPACFAVIQLPHFFGGGSNLMQIYGKNEEFSP